MAGGAPALQPRSAIVDLVSLNIIVIVIGSFLFCSSASAQNVDRIAKREIERRQAALPRGAATLARAQAAMQAKNYAVAHDEFRNALNSLPDALTSAKAHDEALAGFCESGVKVAEQDIADGKFAEAESVAREVLEDRYDPNCRPALELLAHLQQPGYFNKTMGPTFIEKVEEVKKLLADADGYYDSGRFDLAFKKYEQVLALDPYNTAARRGEEKIDNAKYRYGEDAYNETRGRQLSDVQKGWQQPLRQYGAAVSEIFNRASGSLSDTARINHKLNTIIIPRVEFRDASIREAIDFLQQQAAANDPAAEGEKGINIVLRSRRLGEIAPPLPPPAPVEPAQSPAGAPAGGGAPEATAPAPPRPLVAPAVAAPENARITIILNEIPLGDALRYIANQVALKVKVESHAVLLIPISEQSNELITKRYHVPPEFFGGPLDVGFYLGTGIAGGQTGSSQGGGQTSGGAPKSPVASEILEKNALNYQSASGIGTGAGAASASQSIQTTANARQELFNDRQLVGRADAKTFLQSMGVAFPTYPEGCSPGDKSRPCTDAASATFFPHSGALVVRNTADNLDMIDALVEQANASGPKQVEIEAKFIEITQNNLKELGFDWLLGPFNIGNHKLFGSGGTSGTGTGVSASNFPVLDASGNPVGNAGTPFTNSNGSGTGGGPVTAGNRSGTFAISANALDALLAGGTGGMSVAPGIFGLAGVFTDPQFQVVIRALNEKKGIDLLSAPKVTTKSGQRAIIEIVREFRYPTTFTPPQVPNIAAGGTATTNPITGLPIATTVPVVVTPTTPQTFETRNTGVTLEVEPVVGADGATIDLNLVPQVVEFEGFINYGSPINAVGVNTTAGMLSTSVPVRLTDNVINQPIFSTRKVTTSVQVADGQTVVLGGLMREDVQKVEDRTPFLGDLPLVGRLFRSNVDQHVKRNLVIFVTARKVTPLGQAPEEQEEELQPPVLPEIPAYKK
jgi:general secretion pathway protein D